LRVFFAGAAATGAAFAFFDAFFLRPAIVRPLLMLKRNLKRAHDGDTLHGFVRSRQVGC
jgi:GrpB-like predicted nucleotidyltransferase (UPF0157 family)